MKIIRQTYTIKAPVNKVWHALVDPKDIEGWSGTKAVMDAKVGTKFTLWGTEIHGTNLEVIPYKHLKQEWYADYDTPSYVTFILSESNGTTIVELIHEMVPADKFKDIKEGWKDYYMKPLKMYVEAKSTE